MILVLVLIAITVVTLCLTIYLLGRQSLDWYSRKVVSTAVSDLEGAFMFVSPAKLLVICGVVTVIATTGGFLLMSVPGALFGFVGGVVALPVFIIQLKKRRRDQFIYQLPDALRSMAGAMQAGATVVRAIELVGTRQPKPLGQEFSLVLSEYRMGRDLEKSLENLKARVDCEELELLNAAVQVSRTVGGNLSQSLESLASTLQSKAQTEGKVRALTSMGKMQGWVLSMMPVFVGIALYAQKPDEMSLMFTTGIGWLLLFVATLLLISAIYTIRKIVTIDV
ncbi:MAG: type II secretion system F family protein [Marinobacter sp.]|uniref:type II secretion system F family protein n=1 Tax=Marinobacter sp. TaxID=50741 RepID=UPI00349FEB4A